MTKHRNADMRGRANRWLIALALYLGIQLLTACVARPTVPTISPTQQRFNAGLITARDLPKGWGHRELYIPDIPDATARTVVFYGDNPREFPIANVSQDIYIYTDGDASASAFEGVLDEAIPPAYADKWVWPEELEFENHADEIVIGCLPGVANDISFRSCSFVARYDDMIVRVYGQVFEDRWMTMSQFRQLLERVDERMEAAKAP